ncbi:MAG: hypothetical protein ABI594_17195 [Ginsengibacter sp.]
MKVVTLLLLLVHLHASAQHQERTVFVYNIALGGITSGIGAVINKPKQVNWKKAFLKGFWQGDIGGLLNYAGKKTLYLVNRQQKDIYAWPAKLLHAAGSSIIENASLQEPFLQNWNIDFGLLRFDFSFRMQRKFKVRLLPEAIVATIIASDHGRFDFGSSLRTGEMVFKTRDILNLPNTPFAAGVTFGRAIIYVDTPQSVYTKDRILAHELVHRFQYNEYQVFNSWLQPVVKKIRSKALQTIFSKYVYADIPYFFLPYYIDGRYAYPHHYRNFFEFEADRFATNSYVPR